VSKTVAAKTTTPELVVPTQIPTSTPEEISDFLDRPPLEACVGLIRKLLTSNCTLPIVAARPQAARRPFSFRGRIWQHAVGGQNGEKHCLSPAGMGTNCAASIGAFSLLA